MAIELILHREFNDVSDFFNDFRILTVKFSQIVHDAVVLNTESEFIHMFAANAVIGETIKSYYPPQISSELSSNAFTRRVLSDLIDLALTYLHE